VGLPVPASSTAHPTGLQVPSDDSEHKRPPPLLPGSHQTGSQGPVHHLPPPGAESNFKFKVDDEEECDVPAPASERLGAGSKAVSQAGPAAPPAQQYLPELANPELTQALRKIPWVRSIAELLPTLTDPNRRDVKEFFHIIQAPHPDDVSPEIHLCVMWNLGYACANSSHKQRPEAGINPAGTICRHRNYHMCCKCGGRSSAWTCATSLKADIHPRWAWPRTPPHGWKTAKQQKLEYWQTHTRPPRQPTKEHQTHPQSTHLRSFQDAEGTTCPSASTRGETSNLPSPSPPTQATQQRHYSSLRIAPTPPPENSPENQNSGRGSNTRCRLTTSKQCEGFWSRRTIVLPSST
jgi:hypothetical protein